MSDKEQKDYDEAQQEADGDWLGLKHDRVHKDPGGARCAKTARSQSKKRRETLPFLRNQIGWSIEDAAEAFKVSPRDIEHFELEPKAVAPIGYLTCLAQEARKLGWNVDLCGEDGWLDVYHDDDDLFEGDLMGYNKALTILAEDIQVLAHIGLFNVSSMADNKTQELLDLLKKGDPEVEDLQGSLLKIQEELLAGLGHIHKAIDEVEKILPDEEDDL